MAVKGSGSLKRKGAQLDLDGEPLTEAEAAPEQEQEAQEKEEQKSPKPKSPAKPKSKSKPSKPQTSPKAKAKGKAKAKAKGESKPPAKTPKAKSTAKATPQPKAKKTKPGKQLKEGDNNNKNVTRQESFADKALQWKLAAEDKAEAQEKPKEEPEAEEQDGDEEDDQGGEKRDLAKARKFKRMSDAGAIPEHIQEVLSKAKTRAAKTELINELFDKNDKGKLIMKSDKPVFETTKQAKHQKFGRDETMGAPKDVVLHRDYHGDEKALDASIARGTVMVWLQDGVEFAGYRQTVAGIGKTVEDKHQAKSGAKEITDETFQALDKAFRAMTFSFDQDDQPRQAIAAEAASSKEPPVLKQFTESQQALLEEAKGAMERLHSAAMRMISKCSQAKDKESFKPHMLAMKSWMDRDDHLLLWKEFPDSERPLTAATFKDYMCEHSETAVSLNEECEKFKALLKARKELRGGVQQRLQRVEARNDAAPVASNLAHELLERWSWGEVSPQVVQKLAAASQRDFQAVGATPPSEIAALAGLGSAGLYPNNMHKEILKIANKNNAFSKSFKPPWDKLLQTMLLPHVVFSDLYHSYPAAFAKFMMPSGGISKLKEFWRLQKAGHPAWRNHPIVSKRSFDAEHTLPLQLHGDGTPVVGIGKIWSRQLTSYTWNSLLAEGWTKDSMMPSWFCFDETEAGRETTDEFFRIICWSFACLASGVWPAANHLGAKYPAGTVEARRAGTPLANGLRGIIWSLNGDAEYLVQKLQLPHYGSKSSPCALCRCRGDNSDSSWHDCRTSARWLTLGWTRESWLAYPERSSSAIFSNATGLTPLNVHYDYMHCKYLGADQISFGSVLDLLVSHLMADSPLTNLGQCWDKIVTSYKRLGISERYRGFRKLTMFQRKKKCPKLKGRAGQIAAFGEPLLELWEEHMHPDLAVHCKIRTYLRLNIAMEKIMKECRAETAFPEPQATNFIEYAFAMCNLHMELGAHFEAEGLKLFSPLPKLHLLLHTVLLCRHINPRLTWCYKGEDLQKVSRSLAASCARGLRGPAVTVKRVSKLRAAWNLRLSKVSAD
ncbi:unnamed protein product [Symbiodinium sp. CCMP2592]|nr:unnamed protein product [Symbiodinium sp. CCMP2592]